MISYREYGWTSRHRKPWTGLEFINRITITHLPSIHCGCLSKNKLSTISHPHTAAAAFRQICTNNFYFTDVSLNYSTKSIYRSADKSLARRGRKQARKHVGDARDFNIETRAVIKFFFSCKGRRRRKFTQF